MSVFHPLQTLTSDVSLHVDLGRQRSFALPLLPTALILALIGAPLARDLIQHDARSCAEVEAFNHAEHRYANAEFATLNSESTYSSCLVPEPHSELCVLREVALVKQHIRPPFKCGDVTIETKPFRSKCAKHSSVLSNLFTKVHLIADTDSFDSFGSLRSSCQSSGSTRRGSTT